MATDVGTTNPTIGRALAERTSHFSFLQAMWLLQRSLVGAVPVGYQGPPDEEPVRLRPSASLAFPPSDIESIEELNKGHPPYQMTTTFLGLYGAHSPLPTFYAEEILHRLEEDDPVRAFVDIFSHRLLSLFYRGLVRYRGHLLFENSGGDEFSWRLFALAGLSTEALADAGGLPKARLLRFTGHWCQKPHSAASVAAILSTYFRGLRVRVQQCLRRWVYVSDATRCRLGARSCQVGVDATIGERMSDRVGKFRISIGPVNLETYHEFLPGSEKLVALSRLAKLASGGWLAFDVEVVLRGEETPRLGVTLSTEGQLGWTTGLFTRPVHGDLPVVFAECAGIG